MSSVLSLVFYTFIFASVYVQVFLLVTFLENNRKIITRTSKIKLSRYPAVSIVVPCWNEERTIYKTVRSLLALNYPKDKLNILLVDDGSSDGTWNIISKFAHYSNIQVFKKENGGKHSVLNFGLESTDTEFFGCLDADSFVHPEALVRIMSHYEKYPEAMAVVPSITTKDSKNVLQNAQKAEYFMGVYMKKMYDFLGAINVTPGPFTIFKRKVFTELGPYKYAHNTEDMEIAYRMQTNGYKIAHCHDAYVYTSIPETVRKLYRQRTRWIYGFINNTLDYKWAFLKSKYGNFAMFALPTGIVSVLAVSYLSGRIVYSAGEFVYSKFIEYQTVGFNFSGSAPSFDPFFISMQMSLFLVALIYGGILFAIVFGQKMAEGKLKLSINVIYFLVLFRIIAPFWILKAVWNTMISRAPDWR